MNKITILGSGTSTGVPILGCKCKVCQSNEARNKRLRASALIESKSNKTILVDASPDLRAQLISTKTMMVDGAIITHSHADHTHGMDDLRPFTFKKDSPLPVYCDPTTALALTEKFPYIFQRDKVFKDRPIIGGGIPRLDLFPLGEGKFDICGEEVEFFSLPHGHIQTLGFRHGKMAYLVDCKEIPDLVGRSLKDAGLDLLIIDCLREAPHDTHLHLDLALEYIRSIGPELAVLTHMGHELDYSELLRKLRGCCTKNVIPGVDGMSFLYS